MPVTAVIYSHSHVDHWGGVRGILSEEDVKSGKVEIIAPRDFMNHTISENVYAGNAMNRRLFYQYGINLAGQPLRLCRPRPRPEHVHVAPSVSLRRLISSRATSRR